MASRITSTGNMPRWVEDLLHKAATIWEGDDYAPIHVRWIGPRIDGWDGLSGNAKSAQRHITITEWRFKDNGLRAKSRPDLAAVIVHEYAHLVSNVSRSQLHGRVFYENAFLIAIEVLKNGAKVLWERDREYRVMATKVAADIGVPGAVSQMRKRVLA